MPVSPRSWPSTAPLSPVRIGACTVVPVVQVHYRVDPAAFFRGLDTIGLDADAWYWQPPYLDDGRIVIDIGGFAVQTPHSTILVDAGMGNGKDRPNPHMRDRGDPWLDTLAHSGFPPESIDTVIFTHLHGDHVGYTTRHDGIRWVPTFPRARHLVAAAEFEFWTSAAADHDLRRLGDYISDSVLPLHDAGVLDLVDADMRVCDEVRLVAAPGHTPGNVCVEVASQGRRGVFAGDMVHHAIQLALPDLNTDYCVDQPAAATARRKLLDDLADSDDLLFPAHFPGAVPGRIRTDRDGFRYEPVTHDQEDLAFHAE
jgi:glyoxylase-like metal-dependent hydrolase (beta-lactamase superfamily II)